MIEKVKCPTCEKKEMFEREDTLIECESCGEIFWTSEVEEHNGVEL